MSLCNSYCKYSTPKTVDPNGLIGVTGCRQPIRTETDVGLAKLWDSCGVPYLNSCTADPRPIRTSCGQVHHLPGPPNNYNHCDTTKYELLNVKSCGMDQDIGNPVPLMPNTTTVVKPVATTNVAKLQHHIVPVDMLTPTQINYLKGVGMTLPTIHMTKNHSIPVRLITPTQLKYIYSLGQVNNMAYVPKVIPDIQLLNGTPATTRMLAKPAVTTRMPVKPAVNTRMPVKPTALKQNVGVTKPLAIHAIHK